MKNIIFVFAIVLSLFYDSACLNGDSTGSKKNTSQIEINSKNISNETSPVSSGGAAASTPESEIQTNQEIQKSTTASRSSTGDDDLQNQITNNLGGLIVATFYHPHLIEGDFNGDNLTDAAIVVGAEDRESEQPSAIGDLFAGLPYIAEGISFQNLRTNGNLLAKPKQSALDIERNKTKLKPKAKLGLLIILSGSENWKAELSKTDYGKKFLLLDALFGADFENRKDETEWLSKVKKGENCLPAAAKGEGIFSGDAQSAGKVIYFNGKSFAWQQCGE